MHTTRTIAFGCELHHPPLRPDPARIQRIHNALFESGAPAWSSFAVTPMGPLLSNPSVHPEVVSQVAFLPDRIQFREELGALTSELFAARVRQIAQRAVELCGVRALRGQQVTVRSLVNPRHARDAREFMRARLFQFGDELEAFEREPGILGLRLAFPPGDGEADGHGLRIESYGPDPRSLFIEVQSGYGGAVLPDGLAEVEERVLATYAFVTERALRFVERFDRAPAE